MFVEFSIQVEGDEVDFGDFAHVVFHARELLAVLAKNAGEDREIALPLVSLTVSSPATAKWRFTNPNPRTIQEIAGAWGDHAAALADCRVPPDPVKARKHSIAISQVVNGRTSAVLMGRDEASWKIAAHQPQADPPPDTTSFGAVEGELDQLRGRSRTFVIFHPVFERHVLCNFSDERRRQLGELWAEGRRIRVEGLITRDGLTGRPKSVVVERFDQVRVASNEELRAVIGAVKPDPGAQSPVQIIRQLRDGVNG